MDNPTAVYHVARDGQVIGAFSFPTLAEEFKVGSVLATDHKHILACLIESFFGKKL